MATIGDVAKLANVSKMTVSRVINNNEHVKKETRRLVTQAIRELNFRPSMIAKSLVTKQSHVIAHVMFDISDPCNSLISKGLEICCFQHGYVTMICDASSKSRERDYINMLTNRSIDGVVFQQLNISDKQIYNLEQMGVTCVLLDNEKDYLDMYSVNANHYAGGMMAVDYLVSKGHKRIGCIHGVLKRPQGNDIPYVDTYQYMVWRQRTKGFVDGMRKYGLDDRNLYAGNGLAEVARQYIPGIVDSILRDKNRPTAIYCENDLMALTLLNVMHERGLRAPDDLAVIGHDNIPLCHMFHPYITTIAQPWHDLGFQSAAMLIRRLENKETVKKLVLKSELVIGETA
jgi:LacI family transcriptional regulator